MSDKLLKELRGNKRKYRKGLIENNVAKEAQTLLLGAKAEDISTLETLGLDHHIKYERRLQDKLNRTTAIEKIYKHESFTGKEIRDLCKKYYLKMLHVDKYNGPVPRELSKKINEFSKNEIVKITTNNFFILAPVEQFKEVKTIKEYGDPILFYREDNNYSSRLCEAESYEVFSEIFAWGKGFSWLRQYYILWDTKRNKSDEFPGSASPRFKTILSALFFALAIFFLFLGYSTACKVFTIFSLIPISTIFMIKQKADKLWNQKD